MASYCAAPPPAGGFLGYGVAGVIVRVADVEVSGRVPWPPETVERQRRLALALVGRPVD